MAGSAIPSVDPSLLRTGLHIEHPYDTWMWNILWWYDTSIASWKNELTQETFPLRNYFLKLCVCSTWMDTPWRDTFQIKSTCFLVWYTEHCKQMKTIGNAVQVYNVLIDVLESRISYLFMKRKVENLYLMPLVFIWQTPDYLCFCSKSLNLRDITEKGASSGGHLIRKKVILTL